MTKTVLPTPHLSDPLLNIFETCDLGLATFLLTIGHELLRTYAATPRKAAFIFRKKKDTEALVGKYIAGEAHASARRLFEAYRDLRAMATERTGNLR